MTYLYIDPNVLSCGKIISIHTQDKTLLKSLCSGNPITIIPHNKFMNTVKIYDIEPCVKLHINDNSMYRIIYDSNDYVVDGNTITSKNWLDKKEMSVTFKTYPKKQEFIIYTTFGCNDSYNMVIYSDDEQSVIITDKWLHSVNKKVLDVISDWILFQDGTFMKYQNCVKPIVYSHNIIFTLNKIYSNEEHVFYKFIIGTKVHTIIKIVSSNFGYVIKKSITDILEHNNNYIMLQKNPNVYSILEKNNIINKKLSLKKQPNFISLDDFDGSTFEYLQLFFGKTNEVVKFLVDCKLETE